LGFKFGACIYNRRKLDPKAREDFGKILGIGGNTVMGSGISDPE
jgi:hypothetical protein